MADNQPIVIRKSGFLSALALGLFGTIAVIVICGAAIALYAMNLFDRKTDQLFHLTPEVVHTAQRWQTLLPPALADAVRDRRDPSYRQQIELSVQLPGSPENQSVDPIVDVANRGDQTVSLLGVRVVLLDEANVPIQERIVYPATPLAFGPEWPGPLMPGSARRCKLPGPPADLRTRTASVEIVELRLWEGDVTATETGQDAAAAAVDELEASPAPVKAPAGAERAAATDAEAAASSDVDQNTSATSAGAAAADEQDAGAADGADEETANSNTAGAETTDEPAGPEPGPSAEP